MPKKRTTKKFALIEKEILYSQSWAMLTDSARVIYVHLKGEFNGSNGDSLKLPFSQMKKIMSNATYWRGIKLLDEMGFIEVKEHGGLERHPNVYRLSGSWRLKGKTLTEYQEEHRTKEKQIQYRQVVEDEDRG
jgi:hypothetical protein